MALAELGPDAKEVIPGLIAQQCTVNDSLFLPINLADLVKIDRTNPRIKVALVRYLREIEETLSQKQTDPPRISTYPLVLYFRLLVSLAALRELKPPAIEAIPVLEKLSANEKCQGELNAHLVAARWRITGDTNQAVPVLMDHLRTGKRLAPVAAAQVFGEMGPAAKFAVPELTKALHFWTEHTPTGTKSRSRDFNVHGSVIPIDVHAAHALWRIEGKADVVLPALLNNLGSPFTLDTLVEMGPAAAPAVDALMSALSPKDYRSEFVLSISALSGIGIAAGASIPLLSRFLDDSSISIHLAAAGALVHIDPDNEALLPRLMDWLRTGGVYTHIKTAELLGQLGPKASKATPMLRLLLEDPHPRVKAGAADALRKIGAKPTG